MQTLSHTLLWQKQTHKNNAKTTESVRTESGGGRAPSATEEEAHGALGGSKQGPHSAMRTNKHGGTENKSENRRELSTQRRRQNDETDGAQRRRGFHGFDVVF